VGGGDRKLTDHDRGRGWGESEENQEVRCHTMKSYKAESSEARKLISAGGGDSTGFRNGVMREGLIPVTRGGKGASGNL